MNAELQEIISALKAAHKYAQRSISEIDRAQTSTNQELHAQKAKCDAAKCGLLSARALIEAAVDELQGADAEAVAAEAIIPLRDAKTITEDLLAQAITAFLAATGNTVERVSVINEIDCSGDLLTVDVAARLQGIKPLGA